MIRIEISNNNAKVITRDTLTAGQLNSVDVSFAFTSEWENLTRIAVFKSGKITKDVYLDDTNCCKVPPEVTPYKGVAVYVGVYGMRDGVVVLPTVNAWLGIVKDGANPDNDVVATNPDIWQQAIMQMDAIAEIAAEAVDVSNSLVERANKGEFKGDKGDTFTYDDMTREQKENLLTISESVDLREVTTCNQGYDGVQIDKNELSATNAEFIINVKGECFFEVVAETMPDNPVTINVDGERIARLNDGESVRFAGQINENVVVFCGFANVKFLVFERRMSIIKAFGDIESALDQLHGYAQALIGGEA